MADEAKSESIIRFERVTKRFGDQVVLNRLSFQVPRNRITVVIGRSGTGKSVMLKHVMGLLKPDEGRVLVDGVDIGTLSGPALLGLRRRFGMCFQNAALFDSMTVGENVAFPLVEHTRLSAREIQDVVAEKLRLVGLTGVAHKMPGELSGGMRKRVGIARAIALEPEIILYDEPTTGLDPIMASTIDALIRETQEKLGVTCLVISHDIQASLRVGHRLAMLYDGGIRAEGTPEEMLANPDPVLRQFMDGRADGPIRVL